MEFKRIWGELDSSPIEINFKEEIINFLKRQGKGRGVAIKSIKKTIFNSTLINENQENVIIKFIKKTIFSSSLINENKESADTFLRDLLQLKFLKIIEDVGDGNATLTHNYRGFWEGIEIATELFDGSEVDDDNIEEYVPSGNFISGILLSKFTDKINNYGAFDEEVIKFLSEFGIEHQELIPVYLYDDLMEAIDKYFDPAFPRIEPNKFKHKNLRSPKKSSGETKKTIVKNKNISQQPKNVFPLENQSIVFLDTETTGLSAKAGKIVEISIVGYDGRVLFNELINPGQSIGWRATKVHKITDLMVSGLPQFGHHWHKIHSILKNKHIIIYNANFDKKFFPDRLECSNRISCAMQRFKKTYEKLEGRRPKEWNLSFAIDYIGHKWEGNAHRSLSDTKATRALWLWMDKYGK